MTVHHTDVVVAALSELDGCYVLEPEYGTVAFCTDDHVLVVGHVLISSAVFEHISECVRRFGAEGSGRGFEVLLREHGRYVGRHEAVFGHLARVEPYSEGVVTSAHVDFADSRDAGEARLYVDLQIVDDELSVE